LTQIISHCEAHEQQNKYEPDPEPDLLGLFGQGSAADRLDSIEQKMTAIEERDREQI
jgi:hypothetical protein